MAIGISSSTLGISTFLAGSCTLALGLISERSISISGISISALGVSTLAFGISTFAGSAFTSSSFLILGSSISISERSMLGVSALGAWVCVACVLSPTKSSGISKDIGSSISAWTSFVLEGSTFGFSACGITISGISSISIFGDSCSVFSILISLIGSISIGLMTGSSALGASFLSS